MANGQHSFVSQYYEHDVQSYGEVQSNSASNVPYGISPNMTSYTFCTLDPSLDSAPHRQTSSSPIGSESSKSSASSLSSSSLGTVEKGQAGKQGKRKGVPYIPSYMDSSNGPQPCVVCGDSATGYHYRCITCEGCKGFFRRTIQKQLQYHCKWNGQCDIDKATRNQCQQCRYKKCIFVGMAKDLVLSERQRKAKRKLIEENREKRKVESIKLKQKTSNCEHEMLSVYEQTLIKQVNSAYESTVTKVRNRMTVPDGINTEFQSADPEVWQQIADAMTPSIIKVVEFAKGVPGFIQLDVDDQILLLKSCCMEIMCLRASCRYDPDTETLTLYNGMQLHKSQMSQGKLGVLVEPIFEFAVGLSKLKLDKTEVALLAAVLLMQSDRSDLKDADAVERIQDSILGAYKNYVTWKRPDQPVHWAKILMKVTDLRTISTRHAERVLCIRLDNSGEIPPLLFEVFNEGHVQL